MAQESRVQADVPPMRYQAVRKFENGARVVVAAFETEDLAEAFADTMWLRRGHEIIVRPDPVLAARDEEVRRLLRRPVDVTDRIEAQL